MCSHKGSALITYYHTLKWPHVLLLDEYFEASSGYISSIRHLQCEEKTSINPAIIASAGYPMFYPSEAASIWTIFFGEENYVNLLFSDISLNLYTVRYCVFINTLQRSEQVKACYDAFQHSSRQTFV